MRNSLTIDPEFELLIPHLSEKEFQLLEQSLILEGCREPIHVWGRTILDGHNRYRICLKHGLPFQTSSLEISSRDEAIVWICINQMARRNITDETRYYLIGKRYEAEKRIGAKNPRGRNQYSKNKEVLPSQREEPDGLEDRNGERYTAGRLGKIYNVGHNAIEGYGRYARAIDRIERVSPLLSSTILRGDVHLSKANVTLISELDDSQILKFSDAVADGKKGHIQQDEIIAVVEKKERKAQRGQRSTEKHTPQLCLGEQNVKSTPEYDPDSEISTLTFTMPSWRASISRSIANMDLAHVSKSAREALRNELALLYSAVDELLKLL